MPTPCACTAGKPAPFQPQGSPALPLLLALALFILAVSNLRALGAAGAGLLAASPAALAQGVALPLLGAALVLALVMKAGKHLVDKPQLAAELAIPWH